MSLFYGAYEEVHCAVCSGEMSVTSSEKNADGSHKIYVCYQCRNKYSFALCNCGAVHTTFPQFHFSWCVRNRMDFSKEIIARIKEYQAKESTP